jgi:hypothetical protein
MIPVASRIIAALHGHDLVNELSFLVQSDNGRAFGSFDSERRRDFILPGPGEREPALSELCFNTKKSLFQDEYRLSVLSPVSFRRDKTVGDGRKLSLSWNVLFQIPAKDIVLGDIFLYRSIFLFVFRCCPSNRAGAQSQKSKKEGKDGFLKRTKTRNQGKPSVICIRFPSWLIFQISSFLGFTGSRFPTAKASNPRPDL